MFEIPYNNKNREYTIQEGCPWYEAQQAYGAPNVNWCEPTICSYINEPANTWSNLGYLLVALALIRKIKEPLIKLFAASVFAMGTLSFTYHATNNYLAQYFDFLGMYFTMSFFLAFAFLRVQGKDPRKIYTMYWFFFSINSILFMIFDIVDMAVQKIILINAVGIIVLELIAGIKEKRLKEYGYFGLAILFLAIAQTFSILDMRRIWCDPENVFLHGHALWHLTGAIGMLFAGFHINRLLK